MPCHAMPCQCQTRDEVMTMWENDWLILSDNDTRSWLVYQHSQPDRLHAAPPPPSTIKHSLLLALLYTCFSNSNNIPITETKVFTAEDLGRGAMFSLWQKELNNNTCQSKHIMFMQKYCKTLFFHRILISQLSYVENSLHFNFADFPVNFIKQFVSCFFWCL